MVFGSHLQFFDADKYPKFAKLYYLVFGEGYIGVSFFFILSGFILSLNYDDRLLSREVSFREFWVARIARVYPLHLMTMLLGLLLLLYAPNPGAEFMLDVPANLSRLFTNAALLHAFVPEMSYYFSCNWPSWSLSVEMFFYFAFPFLVFLLVRNKLLLRFGWVLLLAIPYLIQLSPDTGYHRFFYINPFFRIVDFLLGILLHQIYKHGYVAKAFRSRLRATAMEVLSIGIMVLIFHYHNAVPQVYRYSCYYWLPMALIILSFSYQRGYLSTMLSTKFLVFLGEISFSFYMIHQLIMRLLIYENQRRELIGNSYVLAAIIFSLSLGLSYVLHKYVEVPCSRYVRNRYRKSAFAQPPLAIAV
ncbi:Peptidoglycan/LPS O-acetylase OafA/YrhL, contains acyltransferase and SGNH-hydrolase domains [Hymenobacter arizonensis]|uniref:Peptidoglycan/LPS O-acetylase OafA/YrhL, contains acyltransferase and SGNH-hydrolase domains n=2 Tax=Hymenobacter arizonensis TaxID=1227077 RepID=A0A1I5WI77_HYMAR|nr:Peptidoglycan/LPS O-acetylase OafA/YrhL, contains acyltransferase and SGNH-hydrolase domains [Hymenobacter arizonensis]